MRAALALTTALLAVTPMAATASAATPAQAIARLNAQRAGNGIPAGIVEVPSLAVGCAHHNAYERANGGDLNHEEQPGRPGYTSDGAYAGAHSVLAGGDWNSINPWEMAPIHLAQLLAPRLDKTGVDDSSGYVCAQTLASRNRPAPAAPVTYTYPGNGNMGIYAREVASESPYTPGERVGLAADAVTGPYLYVFFDGPWSEFAEARITGASLRGPEGPVAVRTVDNTTSGLEGYLPTGGMIIPVAPLRSGSSYTATVAGAVSDPTSASPGDVPLFSSWTFRTRAAPACHVPALRGRTLPATRAALGRAHCRLGRVRYHRGGHGPWRVTTQSPRAGVSRPNGTRVAVTVQHRR